MIKAIDSFNEIKKAKRRYTFGIIFITLLITILVAGAVLLLILSPKNYVPMMIIDIIATAIGLSVIIFFFVNVFPVLRHYYKFYKAMENGTMKKKKIVVFDHEDEQKERDGVIYRQLIFSYVESGETYYDRIFVLDNDSLSFEKGQRVKISTFQNVLCEYEDIKDATI